nr:ribonuclease H-like domain-containing protein [Tanacetum cinerariifolium]
MNAFKSERPQTLKTQFIPKVDVKIDLTKPVTSQSVPKTKESRVVKNDKVISQRMFRINHSRNSKVDNFVPNKHIKASVRTKPITISQPHVINKKDVNSYISGYLLQEYKALLGLEDHNLGAIQRMIWSHKHMSSECNNIKLAIQNDKSKVVCVTCKQILITANHDVCVLNYVNRMNSYDFNKHGNLKLLIIFVWNFLGTVRFGNDYVAAILSYGDLQWANIMITQIIEMINVTFDKLSTMDFEQRSSKSKLQGMTSRQISSRLDLTYAPSTITSQKPTIRELELLYEAMYDDYSGGEPLRATRTALVTPTP